jgi:hypothetical protein
MRELWYRLFWKRETQADRVNSAFRRGFALGAMFALIFLSIASQLL